MTNITIPSGTKAESLYDEEVRPEYRTLGSHTAGTNRAAIQRGFDPSLGIYRLIEDIFNPQGTNGKKPVPYHYSEVGSTGIDKNSPEYQAFSDIFEKAYKKVMARETKVQRRPNEELEAQGAIARWEGDDIYLPKRPKDVLGTLYQYFSSRLNVLRNKKGEYLEKGLDLYFHLHEAVEQLWKEAIGDKFVEEKHEAMLLIKMEDGARKGDRNLQTAYHGALATHGRRFVEGDSFAEKVGIYCSNLRNRVKEVFGADILRLSYNTEGGAS
ncbi:MAG: hypothetical protein HYX24_03385 [Candidatus Aenigmarchaeota archaeon]|nr:hypothetical protein [Candidatus Aenigmarchaeota archaeon]